MFLLEEALRSWSADSQPTAVEAELELLPTLLAFEGHFPGQPVLPAIVQVGFVRALAQKALGTPLQLTNVERGRMSLALQPGDLLKIQLQLTPNHLLEGSPRSWHIRATFTRQSQLATRLSLKAKEVFSLV